MGLLLRLRLLIPLLLLLRAPARLRGPGLVEAEDLGALRVDLNDVGPEGLLLGERLPEAWRGDRLGPRPQHGREDLGMARVSRILDPAAIDPQHAVEDPELRHVPLVRIEAKNSDPLEEDGLGQL